MNDVPNRAAAEGMPKETSAPSSIAARLNSLDTTFANMTAVVALAAELMIDNFNRVGDSCVMPVDAYEQMTSLLVITRDACEAQIRETRR